MAAVLGAVILQVLLTGFTSLSTGEADAYGAPFAVGRSCGFCLFFSGRSETLEWPVLALNTTITAGVLWALMRLGGHALLVPLGGGVFLVLAVVMYVALRSGMPFAGLPLPIAGPVSPHDTYPRVGLLAL